MTAVAVILGGQPSGAEAVEQDGGEVLLQRGHGDVLPVDTGVGVVEQARVP
ncbi:hypothetical protein ACWGKW_23740 [Streptomyces sp. NPDC054766]